MICIDFDFVKYDNNVIKSYFVKYFQFDENEVFVVKYNNFYLCIRMKKFKFLDIL